MSGPGAAEPMDAEFDVMPRWVAEAVATLGTGHAVPAACRGSVGPAGLAWLAEHTHVGPGTVLVDVGGGMGGPAAWARQECGAAPVVVEPQPGACAAAHRMFDLPVVVATGTALPVADDAAAAVWCLGVLCTTTAKARLLRELRRIVAPGGLLGLYALVARGEVVDPPEGNEFPTDVEVAALLTAAGLDARHALDVDGLPDEPRDWADRADAVDDLVHARHGDDPSWRRMQEQEARLARLMRSGAIAARLVVARRPGPEGGPVSRGGAAPPAGTPATTP
ncbi:MAG: class I SAM-dependent methyltransferase [Pseudonocardia sp.]|uniref:class I SAM-dependent methyltransferase n=1 Tax=unclassified Pseudonocardia TaxID=2619320 RepID=UPI000869373B|nr:MULTISPECIES: class I SAM-dependent methyltransferase [unclassified Pseudonocardia]MBN9107401.1 class I SAM-dependent methyltransferase [Pseudonocardia sp.]ODU26637.1 MAG: hypothetical protein ABS80_06410 [Pseudonocardia sp. SCN 72-51]ODV06632.1 MAG: hypothetical protein ABT15_12520 [Pseudonocardia sp. SCN 73-27]